MAACLKPSFRLAVMLAACLALPAQANGLVQVEFVKPASYADASLGFGSGADPQVLELIGQHLQGLGRRCLAAGEAMQVQVLDIDLAGERPWGAAAGRPRIMRDVAWPRIRLSYALRRGDGSVVRAQETVRDMNYLSNSAAVRADTQPLPYERRMLSGWFERRFCS